MRKANSQSRSSLFIFKLLYDPNVKVSKLVKKFMVHYQSLNGIGPGAVRKERKWIVLIIARVFWGWNLLLSVLNGEGWFSETRIDFSRCSVI